MIKLMAALFMLLTTSALADTISLSLTNCTPTTCTYESRGPSYITNSGQARWAAGIVAATDYYKKEREAVLARSDVATWHLSIGDMRYALGCTYATFPATSGPCGSEPDISLSAADLIGALDRNIAWCQDALSKVGITDRSP